MTGILSVDTDSIILDIKHDRAGPGKCPGGKLFAVQAPKLEFSFQNPCKGGRRTLTPQGWPLTSTRIPWHMCVHFSEHVCP